MFSPSMLSGYDRENLNMSSFLCQFFQGFNGTVVELKSFPGPPQLIELAIRKVVSMDGSFKNMFCHT